MSEHVEVRSPADEGVEPFQMLGYLKATLEAGQPITVDLWNTAVAVSKKDRS